MSVIKNSDLLDFEATEKSLTALERKFLDFGKSVTGMFNNLAGVQREYIDSVKRTKAELSAVNPKSTGSNDSIAALGRDAEKSLEALRQFNALIKSMEDVTSYTKRSIDELKTGVSALKKQYDLLDPTAADFSADQKKIADQIKAANSAIKMQSLALQEVKKAVISAEGSYNKLNRETNELKKQLKDLPNAYNLATGALNKNNAQAVIWQQTIIKNTEALKKMDASMGNHQRNVGNYSSALNGLTSGMTSLIGQAIGVATAYEAVSKSLQVIDQMTRLRLSLEAVSSGSAQVSQRWGFLASLADKTGQNVIKLTENYISFSAAARNTALEGQKADKIFSSFAGAFAALGKSSEVAERGLYALQQMLSKGKVSSEELNQQLAESLPGANKLFADALKVSTAELADMMKKGKVLSADVLPKVAAELQRIYGDRASKNLETISGSWERVTNQMSILLDKFNQQAGISKFFSVMNNGLADTLRGLGRVIEKQGIWAGIMAGRKDVTVANDQMRIMDQFKDDTLPNRIARIRIEQDALAKSAEKLASFGKGKIKDPMGWLDTKEEKDAKKDFATRKQFVKDLIDLNTNLRRSERGENEAAKNAPAPTSDDEGKSKRVLTQFEKLTAEAEKVRGIIIDDLLADQKAGRALEPNDKSVEKFNSIYERLRQINDIIGNQMPANLTELYDKINKTPTDIAGSIQIENLGAEPGAKAPSMDPVTDLTKYNALLGVHERELEDIQNRIIDGSLSKINDGYIASLTDQLKRVQELEKQYAVEQGEAKKQAITEELQLEKQKYAEILAMARQDAQARRELQAAAFDLAVESANAAFQIAQDQRAADLEANQMQMEHELSLVQGNEAAQDRIKKEYAKKDLELRQKQARLEKAQAAFSIGISTARAVVSALATSGPPWIGIALAAIVGAMGAVQLAAVLAKPLPQFAKGTMNAPEGPAIVGERGPEIRESKGVRTLISQPSIVPLKRGDKIYTAAQTEAMLSDTGRKGKISAILARNEQGQRDRSQILAGQMALNARSSSAPIDYTKMKDVLVEAMDSRPIVQNLVDERGLSRRIVRKNNTTTYLDARFSLMS